MCTQGKCHITMEAEIKVMLLLQDKVCPRLPANPQKLGEIHERDSPSRTSKETSPAHIISIISDSVYGSSGKQIQYGNTMQFHSYMLDKRLILHSKFIFK